MIKQITEGFRFLNLRNFYFILREVGCLWKIGSKDGIWSDAISREPVLMVKYNVEWNRRMEAGKLREAMALIPPWQNGGLMGFPSPRHGEKKVNSNPDHLDSRRGPVPGLRPVFTFWLKEWCCPSLAVWPQASYCPPLRFGFLILKKRMESRLPSSGCHSF